MKTIGDAFGSVLGAHASGNNKALVQLTKKLIAEICGNTKCKVVRAIADWEFGAGAGVFASLPQTLPPEQTKKLSAKLGLATNSHSVLSFVSGGSESLHILLTNETNAGVIRQALPKVKIKTLCIIPHVKGTILIIHDPKSILEKNVQALVRMFKGKHIVIKGKGTYIGSDASDPETAKKKAKQAFRKALGIQETNNPDSSPNGANKGEGEKSGKSSVQGASRSSGKGSVGKDKIARRPGTFKPK